MLGFPPEDDAELFRGFVNHVLEGGRPAVEERVGGFVDLFDYLTAQIDDHVDHPPRRPDHATCSTSSSTGVTLDASHVIGTIALLLIAGIDTTWSAIGASIWHLATTPRRPRAARRRARAAAGGHGGAAAGLRTGHHGPAGEGRLRLRRLPDEGRRLGAAVLPGRQPRPGACSSTPTRWSSTARSTATPPSAWGSTAASGRTWPAWSCAWRSRSGCARFPAFHLADPEAVRWSGGQVRGPRTLPVAIG